jgi:hypothetical protein
MSGVREDASSRFFRDAISNVEMQSRDLGEMKDLVFHSVLSPLPLF